MSSIKRLATLALLNLAPALAVAQQPVIPVPQDDITTLTTRTTLVLVPALVKTKSNQLVYTLTAKDFILTDDGFEQNLSLEEDTGSEPLALVIAVETGGAGAAQLEKYKDLAPEIEAMVGNVPHKVAVVTFDSTPTLYQKFTPTLTIVADALNELDPGDKDAGILDALTFSVDLLRRQPQQYRRAILLISETIDHGSHTKLDDALRVIGDTNTAIYSLAFNSTRAAVGKETSKLSSSTPGPAHGCMSRDPNDPNVDLDTSRLAQAWECLSLLAPPLRALKMMEILGTNNLRRNVPETVAHLTGGEYYKFSDAKGIQRSLQTLSNHIPNRYILSFHPQAPHPGFHYVSLRLRDYDHLSVAARNSYWANDSNAKP